MLRAPASFALQGMEPFVQSRISELFQLLTQCGDGMCLRCQTLSLPRTAFIPANETMRPNIQAAPGPRRSTFREAALMLGGGHRSEFVRPLEGLPEAAPPLRGQGRGFQCHADHRTLAVEQFHVGVRL
jgi:hypothetical protein